jgi:hypothetical protein
MVPVQRETHASQVWRSLVTYSFAARESYVPIAGVELARVGSAMPIGFVELSGQFVPVAILSLSSGQNLFVGPGGRWMGNYIPVLFRAYPFRLLRKEGTDQYSLWVDEDAQSLPDTAATTEPFYDAEGNLAPGTKLMFDMLAQFEQNRLGTAVAVAALAGEGVIAPWKIKVQDGENERLIGGLHRVDEVALAGLSDEAFLRLRTSGALPVAYAQLLSMGQIGVFSHLAELRRRLSQGAATPSPPQAPLQSPDKAFVMLDPDTLRFD